VAVCAASLPSGTAAVVAYKQFALRQLANITVVAMVKTRQASETLGFLLGCQYDRLAMECIH